ncbi:hypothetical protein V1224_03410 [Lachnospiraceae bacterium JLR.KK008]
MAEFSKLMMTGKGQALIAKVIAGTGNVEFTKIVTSSTAYEPEQTEGLTELANVEQTSLISSIMRTNEVAVKIETSFNNLELTAGYYMRSLGLYAIDPDEGEILYAVTTEVSGNCYMPAYNGVTVSGAYVKLIATVGNAEHISLEVNAAATATIGNIRELRENLGSVEIRFDDVEDAERENIQSRETLGTMLGKIRKWFSDLKSGAFASVVNDCVTTEEGTVLDGRQGKVLKDEIDGLKAADSEINSKIDALKKSVADGKTAVAAAISAKGVSTAADTSFATMANNIRNIVTIRQPNTIRFSKHGRQCSFSQGVTTGKHYLITYAAVNKYEMSGWANGNWSGNGGNFVEIYRNQQPPTSMLAVYVTATSGSISFSKDYGNDNLTGAGCLMLQLD